MKKTIIAVMAAATLAACEETAPEVGLTVNCEKTEISVGEPLKVYITHDLDGLTVYSGDEGHAYANSAAFILQGKTEEDIRNNVYRPTDGDIVPLKYGFEDATPGTSEIGNGLVQLLNAGMGTNLMGTEGSIVDDDVCGHKALQITSTHPEWWYQALRINVNSKVGSNKKLTLRMHFSHDYLTTLSTNVPNNLTSTFGVVIRLAGHDKDETTPTFSEASVWDIAWAPSVESRDYQVDLARIVTEWESATGKTMYALDYIQVLFTAAYTSAGNAGYVGDYWIESINYGDYDYKAFDTGESFNLGEGPGTLVYTHTYDKPGEYTLTVIGTTTGWKNHGSGYRDSYEGVSSSEYDYSHQVQEIKIKVKE